MDSSPIKTTLLLVSLTDQYTEHNKVHKIGTGDASLLSNSPVITGSFYAKWECIFFQYAEGSGTRLMVKITEFYPVAGRVWYNHYNWTTWTGWVSNYERVSNLQTSVSNHTSNKSNPDGVTAAQVGAPGLQSGVAIFNNLGGIGLNTTGGNYWQLWNLQEGTSSTHYTALTPTKDNCQILGYPSLRMRAVHAYKLYGDWSGGYVDSSINILNKLMFKADGEGGNIRFTSKDSLNHWEMDACMNNTFRLYHGTETGHKNGVVEYDKGWSFNSDDGLIYSEAGKFVVQSNMESYVKSMAKWSHISDSQIVVNTTYISSSTDSSYIIKLPITDPNNTSKSLYVVNFRLVRNTSNSMSTDDNYHVCTIPVKPTSTRSLSVAGSYENGGKTRGVACIRDDGQVVFSGTSTSNYLYISGLIYA